MNRVNIKEQQRIALLFIYLGTLASCPPDFMDTFLVNHHYQSVHWGTSVIVRLVIAAYLLLWSLTVAWRPLQKIALASLLSVAVGIAVLTRFGVQTHDAQLIGKMLILAWWIAVLALISDWISARVSKRRGSVEAKEAASPFDLTADKARNFLLKRLRDQAADMNIGVSDLELRFLDYSRIVPARAASFLEDEFFQTHDYEAFKRQIRALTTQAVKHDRESDPGALKRYCRMLRDLKRGRHDQQLVLLIERGILDARTDSEKFRDWTLYILIGLSLLAILIFLASHFLRA